MLRRNVTGLQVLWHRSAYYAMGVVDAAHACWSHEEAPAIALILQLGLTDHIITKAPSPARLADQLSQEEKGVFM